MKNFFWILCLLGIGFFAWSHLKKDTVYIHPGPSWQKLFDEHGNGFYGIRHHLETKGIKLREKRYVKKLKNAKNLIFFDVQTHNEPYFGNYNSILWIWEPPSVIPENFDPKYHQKFSKIYTTADDLVDNKKYFKFYYPQDSFVITTTGRSFVEKKLCTLINAPHVSKHPNELYSEREKIIAFFENKAPEDFDLLGKNWDPKKYKTYKGSVLDKHILGNYRFAICYENISSINGYITEKIFDVFKASCVPVYWGAPNITKYVPKNCFIDRRDFQTDEELYSYLKNMSEEEHAEYLQNIRIYLQSEKCQLFSLKHFIKTMEESIDLI